MNFLTKRIIVNSILVLGSILLPLIFVIFILVIFISPAILNRSPECGPIKEVQHGSPDGRYDLRVANQYCSGAFVGSSADRHWIVLRDTTKPNDREIRVFEALDFAPDVVWADGQHVIVTISQVSFVNTSIHRANDVAVTYHLADRLLEDNFRKQMEEYEQRTADSLKNRRATFTGNPLTDGAALKHVIEMEWKQYRRFKEWAVANADNGNL
jgi:hypothetical protein